MRARLPALAAPLLALLSAAVALQPSYAAKTFYLSSSGDDGAAGTRCVHLPLPTCSGSLANARAPARRTCARQLQIRTGGAAGTYGAAECQ